MEGPMSSFSLELGNWLELEPTLLIGNYLLEFWARKIQKHKNKHWPITSIQANPDLPPAPYRRNEETELQKEIRQFRGRAATLPFWILIYTLESDSNQYTLSLCVLQYAGSRNTQTPHIKWHISWVHHCLWLEWVLQLYVSISGHRFKSGQPEVHIMLRINPDCLANMYLLIFITILPHYCKFSLCKLLVYGILILCTFYPLERTAVWVYKSHKPFWVFK